MNNFGIPLASQAFQETRRFTSHQESVLEDVGKHIAKAQQEGAYSATYWFNEKKAHLFVGYLAEQGYSVTYISKSSDVNKEIGDVCLISWSNPTN